MPETVSALHISRRLGAQKLLLFLAVYLAVFLLSLFLITVGSTWLKGLASGLWWVGPVGLFTVMGTITPIVYLALVRRLEHRLLRDQRRYHRTLITASSGMTRIKEIQRLCRLIVYMVNRTVRLTNAGLFLYDPKEQRYHLQSVRYRSLIPTGLSLEQADPLVALLQEEKDLVMVDELQAEMETKRSEGRMRKAAWVYSWMRKLEARLLVPSFSNNRLLAFLILGAKRTDEPYTTDDIALFSGLANQAALAIENAMFFEELRNNEAYIIQSEKLASLGQLASGMAHEIHNPLTIISGEAQLFLERFKGQDPNADQVLQSIVEECQRAADITRRILRFAKPAPPDLTPLDLKTTIEETLTLVGYQVRLDKVERIVHVPPNLPKVRGNQNQLQEVILNLILNACQAMGEQGGRLELRAFTSNAFVQVQVADTGPGIPAAKLRQVFDPFYTTKATGTGLGLFVSQRIIRAHGGTLDVSSTEGRGACFTIALPIWQEGGSPAAPIPSVPPSPTAGVPPTSGVVAGRRA